MERRKIVYQDRSYQVLKPEENGNFFHYGKRKSIKAISDLEESRQFDLIISEDIKKIIEEYRKRRKESSEEILSEKNSLESKLK